MLDIESVKPSRPKLIKPFISFNKTITFNFHDLGHVVGLQIVAFLFKLPVYVEKKVYKKKFIIMLSCSVDKKSMEKAISEPLTDVHP